MNKRNKNYILSECSEQRLCEGYKSGTPITLLSKEYGIGRNTAVNYLIKNNMYNPRGVGDLTGLRTGMITVLFKCSDVYRNGRKYKRYTCLCDCGVIFDCEQMYLRKTTTDVKSCGCYQYNFKFGKSVENSIYNIYAANAKSRGIGFYLSKDMFINTIKKDCFYCGIEPKRLFFADRQIGKILCNGIDRVDNNIGYTIKNSVPCCKDCNFAKKELSFEVFSGWINNIYNKYTYGLYDNTKTYANYDKKSLNHWKRDYKKGAKRRKIDYEIEDDFFKSLVSSSCYYCGEKPSRIHCLDKKRNKLHNLYNGIDRVDNNLGYIKNNVVPCCSKCNMAKRVKDKDDFIKWAISVYFNSVLKSYE